MDKLQEGEFAIITDPEQRNESYLGVVVQVIYEEPNMGDVYEVYTQTTTKQEILRLRREEMSRATTIPSKQYEAMLELYQFCLDHDIAAPFFVSAEFELAEEASRLVEGVEEWVT